MKRMLLLAAGLTLAACTDQTLPTAVPAGGNASVLGAVGPTVMTRNLYLGADLNPLLQAGSPQQVPIIAATVWGKIQATNIPARAGALADEIVQMHPHLVGLQEAVLYQVQSPGDAALGGMTPATTVAYDFVQLLLDSLAVRGAAYVVASQVTGTVVELPVFTGVGPIPFDDVRFTDRDVIIARADVATMDPLAGVFTARVTVPIGGPGGPMLNQVRGWASVDASVLGHTFRFISTHLEVQSVAPIQVLQGLELIAIATASPLPVVLLGDFNSAADGTQTPTYANIVAAGFQDVWNHRGNPGYTCCHDEGLMNARAELDQRIDAIFLRGFRTSDIGSIGARVSLVGDKPRARLPSGLWPSDHAGVVASLRLTPAALALP